MRKLLISCIVLVLAASPALAGELSRTDLTSGQPVSLDKAAVDAGADTFVNDGRTFLVVFNDTTVSCTVTVKKQKDELKTTGFGVISIADIVFSVSSGDSAVAVPAGAYNNSNGRAEVSYAGDTSTVTVGVFRRQTD